MRCYILHKTNEIYHENGDYYCGSIHNNMANGFGKKIYNDGMIYKGFWKKGIWHGYGEIIYNNNEKYKGMFINGQREGHGTYIWKNGTIYVGKWKKNDINGYGSIQSCLDLNRIHTCMWR